MNGTDGLVVSKREAAAQLGISERTLHSLIASERLRVVRIGRRVLVPRDELRALIAPDNRRTEVSSSLQPTDGRS